MVSSGPCLIKLEFSKLSASIQGSQSYLEDSCRGDSGAPLMIRREDDSFEAIGVTSFGNSKCDSSTPTIFARVESFIKWIEFVVTDSVLKDRTLII